jgi:outer membrane protein assembly factor BamB
MNYSKLIISTFVFIISFSGLIAQDLVQWRGADRNGVYNETGLLKEWPAEGPKLLWSIDGLGQGFTSVTVVDSKLYTTGIIEGKGFVFCIGTDGKLVWKKEYGKDWTESFPGTRTTLVYNKAKLYLATAYGDALCLDAATGNKVWSVDMATKYGSRTPKWGIVEAPVILGDNVFFTPGGKDVTMVALNSITGAEIWKSKLTGDSSAYCSPLIVNHKGKNIIITSLSTNIVGVDADNGELLWKVSQTNTWGIHPNTPLYKDGLVYSTTGYKTGGVMFKIADDSKSVTELWRNTTLDSQMGGAIWINNMIVGSGMSSDRSWQALDPKTGNVLFKSTEIGKGVVIYADGLFYCYADNGEMGIMEIADNSFKLKSKFRITLGSEQHWAHPVIDKAVLYIRHGNTLMAYNIKK